MKKHIFAFICIFVLMFNTFAYTQTKAMDIGVAIDVGSDILYEGWDMIQSIFNGFAISLGQYSGYADKTAAMGAFYNDWGDVLTVLTQGYLTPDQVEQSAISGSVYPLDFGMTGSIMRDFVNQYGNWIYNPTLGVYADINQKSLAAWNRFNDGWVNRFINEHNKDIESHPTYPDVNYNSYLNYINNDGFFFKSWNYSTLYPQYTNISLNLYPASTYSWCVFTDSGINNSTILNNNDSNYWASNTCYLTSVYITSNNNTYTYTYSGVCPLNFNYFSNNYNSAIYRLVGNDKYIQAGYKNIGTYTYNSGTFNSLTALFDDLKHHVKNVNIYVDGVLWSYVGQDRLPLITAPDHPIYDENGQIIGNDVYFPEQDLKADIVKFTELIDDKILTGDTIDLDDLIDAGVLTDSEGNIITDENRDEYIKKRDIANVITDALDDDAVTDLLPDAPNPPDDDPWNWDFPTIVIPESGDPDPRGTGLSVLARIVNVTNQSLPAEVITMFWGIVITMVILGIIKILHK